MTPEQFRTQLTRQGPRATYLFLGPDSYERNICRTLLLDAVLPIDEREQGYSRHDLDQVSLAEVIDDACSMSLFARRRLLWVSGAEGALPRRLSGDEEESGVGAMLVDWIRNPAPDTTIVFDCQRYDFEGDDKAKIDRVAKFYKSVPDVVEFARYSPEKARALALSLAKQHQIQLANNEADFLVEATGADASRIANEIEKLSLRIGPGGTVTGELITELVPNARAANIFALVNAIGRGDRMKSLDLLDTLIREGEYLPLALSFLATQFRFALAAHEAGLKGAMAIQGYFQKSGVAMWKSRAEQVAQTVAEFPRERLAQAIRNVADADRALRDTRPDDQIVMEEFVWKLTR